MLMFVVKNVGLIYWYVYDGDGNQIWLVGAGNYENDMLSVSLSMSIDGCLTGCQTSDEFVTLFQ